MGSGKSYFVIDDLIKHWKRGGTACVSDSFCVNWDACKKLVEDRDGLILEDDQFREVPADAIQRIHEHTPPGTPECPVLIVIDEAQDHLDVRDHSNKGKQDLFSWACQSRHDDNDLLFVTQNAKNIDARIRRLATFTWSVKNLATFTLPGLGVEFPKLVNILTLGINKGLYFIRTQLDHDGRTPTGTQLWVRHDPKLFACYNSKSMRLSRRRGGEEVKRKQLKKNKRKHPMIKYALLVGGAVLTWGIYSLFAHGGPFTAFKKAEHAPAPTHPSGAAQSETILHSLTTQRPPYETRRETWKAISKGYMKTDSAEYKAGQMTVDGMCIGVQGSIARITKPNGETLYVVGDYPAGAVRSETRIVPVK